jgi:hypothetical protein
MQCIIVNQFYLSGNMEKIIADSSSVSQWNERKIRLAKELRKFGIDIDNDSAMKSDEATMKRLLVEKTSSPPIKSNYLHFLLTYRFI